MIGLSQEQAWYWKHREALRTEYEGQWILIKDNKVLSSHPSRAFVLIPEDSNQSFSPPFFVVRCGDEWSLPPQPVLPLPGQEPMMQIDQLVPPHEKELQKLPLGSFDHIYRFGGTTAWSRVWITCAVSTSIPADKFEVPVTFLVDTGAPTSYLTRKYIQALNLTQAGGSVSYLGKIKGVSILFDDAVLCKQNINILGMDLLAMSNFSMDAALGKMDIAIKDPAALKSLRKLAQGWVCPAKNLTKNPYE